MRVRPRQFFAEPRGWKTARGLIAASLVAFGLYLSQVLRYGGSVRVPVVGGAIAIAGIAELLPEDRRRTAIAVRVAAIGILVSQFVSTFI